jgi:2-oxoisovalerate dehydrogenase E2 component (dihydrolipoyl transacylase)
MQVGAPLVEFAGGPEPEPDAVAHAGAPPIPRDLPQPAAAPRATCGAVLAAPATRARAIAQGVDLQRVAGTGPGGRITPHDLENHVALERHVPRSADGVTEIKIVGLQRLIAERMETAVRRIPHFSYIEEFDLTSLDALRRTLNEKREETAPKLTLLPFFVRALVQLRAAFPRMNAWYDDDAGILRVHESVHAGIATQTPAGLVVAVIRHADTMDLWGCARAIRRVTEAAREGRATREELSGSTITLSSLGALGGLAATPIINRPEVAILAPNKLIDRPVVRDGAIVIRTMMNMSSSFDHRVTGGFEAASFIQALKGLLENPDCLV